MTDGPSNPILHKQIHPGLQFLTFMGLTLALLFIGTLIGLAIIMGSFGIDTINDIMTLNISSHRTQDALWILQLTGTTLPLLICPVFFSYVIAREPENYLKTSFHFPWLLLIIVFLTMMLSGPLIEFLGNINQKMVLPKFLKGVEDWMRKSENDAQKLSDSMMQMKTIKSMLFDLLFIGLLTAIVEEFMFRGCLQTIFVRWTKKPHAAIWITAILFSAFHMEFFGFLPRLLLGVLFGYFTYWSGSVWPAVWAHFVNNGTVVVVTYLFQHKLINMNPNDQQVFSYGGYVISLIITLFLLFVYRYISSKKQIADIDGEELD
jgi:membrane protease YdiL (CAAX protease family)